MAGPQVFIAGFPTTDKVPGAYGEVVYGAGGNSAASAILKCMLVGQRTSSGNLSRDTEVRQVWSLSDIDAGAGAGAELATMGYDGLAAAPGAPLYLIAPTPAGGATQATAQLTIAGSSVSAGGTVNIRIGGYVVGTQVQTTDTPTTIGANIAANVNGANNGRLPVTASATSGVVTFTCASAGIRGMQHVLFLDLSQGPTMTGGSNPGIYWYLKWATSTSFPAGEMVVPSTANDYYYESAARTPASGTGATNTQSSNTSTITGVTGATADWVGQSFVVTDASHTANSGTWTILSASTASGGTVTYTNAAPGVNSTTINWSVTFNSTSFTAAPTWPTTIGSTVNDGGITWTCWGSTVTSSANVIGVNLGNATGTETFTNTLTTLASLNYDRIGLAANDATSLAAWLTQINSQAGVLTGIYQHVVVGFNGTLTAATTITGSTLNAQRFQLAWQLNSETHPSRMAASLAALATVTEQNDPAAMYDGVAVPTIVPQSQKPDWPSHGTLVSALNSGVTPMFTYGDGQARICRSITTHYLNGSNNDFSTLDTAQARCPDFVVKWLMGYWTGIYLPANPRVQPDPLPQDRPPPTGVGYPHSWSSAAQGQIQQMMDGRIPGTCPPILIANANGSTTTSSWDANAKRIISAVPVTVAPGDHQVGISVRGQA